MASALDKVVWSARRNSYGLFVTETAPYYVIASVLPNGQDKPHAICYGKLPERESTQVLPLTEEDKQVLQAKGLRVEG
jgi:hypothetical protein